MDEIDNQILNENYISAVELLLTKYNSSSDPDYLETIHNILSHPQINSNFPDEFVNTLNKILDAKGFESIIKNVIENKIGSAEFPVVGEDNSSNAIRTIEVNDGKDNIGIDSKIVNKKEFFNIIRFVQIKTQENLCDIEGSTRDVTILNWGLDFKIREHQLKGRKYNLEDLNFAIKGTSLHFAAVVACVSKIFNLPVNSDYIFTGAFNEKGEALGVTSLDKKVKLISKERPNTKKIFIPPKSKFNEEEQKIISSDKFVEVENIQRLIEKVFNKKLIDIAKVKLNVRKNLGRARIWAEHVGKKKLTFNRDFSEAKSETKNVVVLHFIRPDDDPTAFKIFPVEKVYHEFNDFNFIIFEGAVANHYTGQLMTSNDYRQSNCIFGVRLGRSKEVLVFAAPRGSNLLGYKCDFF